MLRLIVVAAAALLGGTAALPLPALAQTYYVGLRGGYAQIHDADLEVPGAPPREAAFAGAPTAGLAFGFASHDGWRIEGELLWSRADIDAVSGVTTNGEAETWTALANLYYGFRSDATLTPYIGVGLGGVRVAVSDFAAGPGGVDDFDVAPAWQAMAGLDLRVSDAATLSLEYRYLVADQLDLNDESGGIVRMDYASSSALAGLRFGF